MNAYRFFILSVAVLIFSTAPAQQINNANYQYSPEVEARIRQVEEQTGLVRYTVKGVKNTGLQERMEKYHIKGITVAVINDYKVEWAKAYGWADVKEKRPVTPATLFQPGSISKSLNALAVLKQVQDKKLDLQADINEYLRSWKFPYDSVSKGKKITLLNLLSHTAGLSVHGFPGYFYNEKRPTLQQILDGLPPAKTRPVRSMFEPGLKFQYSGGGTMISEQILLDITGKPYDQLLAETVFRPLGMETSLFTQPPPDSLKYKLATGYEDNGKKPIRGNYPILLEQAAGGLWTTPTELARFIIEIQLSAQGKSNKVLTQEMTNLMLTPYIDKAAALGMFIEQPNGGKYFQHSAGNQGFSGKYYGSLQDGKGVVIFMNADYGQQLIDEFINSVAFVYKWTGKYDEKAPVVKETVTLQAATQEDYKGIYKEDNGGAVVVIEDNKDGGLQYSSGWSGPWKMYFSSPTEFINLESKSEKQFVKENGKISILRSLDGKLLATAAPVKVITLPAELLKKYAGKYAQDPNDVGKIVLKDGGLWLDDGDPRKLYFTSETEFFIAQDTGVTYSMVINDQKTVEGIKAVQQGEERIFKRVK